MPEPFAVPVAVSLAVPAVRLVVVEAWAEGGRPMFHLHPVVAIRSTVHHDLMESPRGGRSPMAGEVVDEPLVAVDDDLMPAGAAFGRVANGTFGLATCPWHPAEDDERLAPLVERLSSEAVAKEQRSRGERAATRPPGPLAARVAGNAATP